MTATTIKPSSSRSSATAEVPGTTRTVIQLTGTFGEGGAERLAHNLGIGLKEFGLSSVGVAVRKAGTFVGVHPSGVEVIELGASWRHPWSVLAAAIGLRRLIIERNVQLVHVHGERSLPFAVAVVRALPRSHRPQLWFTWHIPDSILADGPVWNALCIGAMRRCHRVYGASQAIVDVLMKAGIEAEVFVNGVPEVPCTAAFDSADPVVLWQARMAPTKDPKALVRVAARLKAEGVAFRIIMAGSGVGRWEWFEKEVHELAAELDVADRISFPGWVADINELLPQANIGVQTSHFEGLSMSLLEQMMAGLAVVATDVGDTRAAVAHDRTGCIVPPRDEEALYQELRKLIVDRDSRQRLGAAAREEALERFTLRAMAQQVSSRLSPLDTR